MSNNTDSPLFFLKATNSVHWFLFGENKNTKRIYFIEIIGNGSTNTRILSKQEARQLWKSLNDDGFERTELRDAGAIPSHVDQRVREWWKFVNNNFLDKVYKHDPWGSRVVEGNDAKTLSDIAQNKTFNPIADEPYPIANFWEYREPEEDGSDRSNREDDADDDNYWNKEGAFEYASDKSDEYAVMIGNIMVDPPEPEWNKNECEEDEQEHDESYQRWATEEGERDEEIEQAMEEYYASEDSQDQN
jgi:hypothetical protein